MICPKCSKEIPAGSQFCLQCGSRIEESAQPESVFDFLTKSRSITNTKKQSQTLVVILLAIIVGCVVYGIANGGFLETISEATQSLGLSDQDFTIRVTGDTGMKFHGSYMIVSTSGSSSSQSVEGATPATYNVTGKIVSTTFQKQHDAGSLKVEILRGGSVVKESSTTASYGVVSVATN